MSQFPDMYFLTSHSGPHPLDPRPPAFSDPLDNQRVTPRHSPVLPSPHHSLPPPSHKLSPAHTPPPSPRYNLPPPSPMLSPTRTPPPSSPYHSSPSTPNTPRSKPSPLPRTRVPAPQVKKEDSMEEYIDPKIFQEERARLLEVSSAVV